VIVSPQPSLRTERLLLRPFTLADASGVQRLAGDRAVADTTLNIPHPYADGMAEAWIATHAAAYADGNFANFAVVLAANGSLVGAIGLAIAAQHQRAELGYWIGKGHWGHGYCTEACRAVIDFVFNELRLHRLRAECMRRNPASARVLEKLGFRHEGCLRQHVVKWELAEDIEQYGLLRSEWT
jgi:ribosomal-protein-alanine N-acetyltransferase